MQAMLLIHSDEKAWAAMSEAERGAGFAAYGAYTAALRAAGAYVGGAPLEPSSAAHTVRVSGGAPQVLDGPYAETREQLGGYYLIQCENLDEAIQWAAKIPAARDGCVEVRPVVEWT